MSAPADAGSRRAPAPGVARHESSLTGTGLLLRFMLRRDRLRLPAWVLGLTLLMVYFANALGAVIDDDESLAAMAALASNPMMALIGGPGYGYDALTIPRFLTGIYAVYLMLAAALMSILTVARHTRVEEQSGRAELVRSNVVGRDAQLTAALLLTGLMNLAVSLLCAAVLLIADLEPAPTVNHALLFGFSIGAAGLVFAGVAAVSAQLSAYSRACSGIAGAFLGAAFVVRGLGDMSHVQGGGLAWLSWLSPLGWVQQTAPFTLDRWWPLLPAVAATVVLIGAAYALSRRRDLAGGMVSDRPGPAGAPSWLGGPAALALRLQQSGLIGWSFAIGIAGLVFGSFAGPMADSVDDMPDEIVAVMGGRDGMVEGYLGFMGLYFAIMVAVYALLAIQALRAEEQGYRIEPVLAAAVGRSRWLLSWTGVAALGSAWLLLLAGATSGIGAGEWDLVGPVLLGYLVQTAAVWALLGLAVALYGWLPQALSAAWVVFVYGAFMSLFGQLMQVDRFWLNTSPFGHIGQYPAGPVSWGGVVALVAVAVALVAAGVAGFSRRDLRTA